MLRRLGTLAVAIVLAALPSLNRICLTGCDVEKSPAARAARSIVEMTTEAPGGGDRNCPLHGSQSAPRPTETSGAPWSPSSPCQHQQEMASADYAKSRSLELDTDSSLGTLAPLTVADPIWVAIDAPIANLHRISAHRSAHGLVLRI